MTKPSFRYFLYVRKSEEAEDRQVASIPAQIAELKELAKKKNLNIVDELSEMKSAKAPGRAVFTEMIARILKGEADGILCWKLDRLARNPIDGGTIIWMLQQNTIKQIETFQRTYKPEDNTLFMHIEFGMANQFILDLSVNTKRGQRNRAKEGWLPHKPPLGYYNKPDEKPDRPSIIDTDSINFPLMKRLWEILLQEKCSIMKLYETAQKLGLKTHRRENISRANFYRLFQNPFYYGHFYWQGELYPGKHEAMITKTEFDLAQSIINGRSNPRSQQHIFAFTGLIRCGECGASITAEKKTKHQKNGNVHHYTYYRCTKRINPKCTQKPIRKDELERQIITILAQIEIPPSFHKWAIKYLKEEQTKEQVDRDEIIKSHQRSMGNCIRKIDNLFNMRVNEEVSAKEYTSKKEQLLKQKQKYEQLIADSHQRIETWLQRAESLFSFAEIAKNRFEIGSLADKRDILSCLGSNLTLTDRILRFDVGKGLAVFRKLAPEVQSLHNRLEPLKAKSSRRDWEDLYSKNKKWGG